ncbi:hypothetical protein AYO44_13550 [Planctomycetaceae bacterium SCGC AG-212-F19]|nr:hypothetical protein AYO44_13550 [Planctomycetaceae bacterium SCGC AG-212-F19]
MMRITGTNLSTWVPSFNWPRDAAEALFPPGTWNRPLTSTRQWVLVYILLASCWALANWPALTRAWWYCDDYKLANWSSADRWGMGTVGCGRPLLGLWSFTFLLDQSRTATGTNVALRLVQGAVHVLTCTLIALLLLRAIRSRFAVAAVLPFTVWCFNGDAVLWRTGASYALAAFLSVAGLVAVRTEGSGYARYCWVAGVGLCILSMLVVQASAVTGLVVWTILLAVAVVDSNPFPFRSYGRQGALLVVGYFLGGCLSLLLAVLSPVRSPRVAFALDWHSKWQYLLEMNREFLLFPQFYPVSLQIAHLLLCAGALGLCVHAGSGFSKQGIFVRWKVIVAAGAFMSCFITPYLFLILVAENLVCWRVMYPAPLVIVAAAVIGYQSTARSPRLRLAIALLLGLVVCSYTELGRKNAREYLRRERCDVAVLKDIERLARECNTDRLVVLTGAVPGRDLDPYHLKLFYKDSHYSAFSLGNSVNHFIRFYSALEIVTDEAEKATAIAMTRGTGPGLHLFYLDTARALVIYPP